MEPTKKKCSLNKGLSITDLLCSAGYLPPRNEQDIERFERIYSSRRFETEAYLIKANAIFDKVTDEDKTTIRRLRPKTTIFDRPGALRVADGTSKSYDDSVSETLSQLIKEKKD